MMTTSTGSMNLSPVVGTFDFLEDGTINIFTPQDVLFDEEVVTSFRVTSEFIFYALTRQDWMSEFLISNPDSFKTFFESLPSEKQSPRLTLIKGGKEE